MQDEGVMLDESLSAQLAAMTDRAEKAEEERDDARNLVEWWHREHVADTHNHELTERFINEHIVCAQGQLAAMTAERDAALAREAMLRKALRWAVELVNEWREGGGINSDHWNDWLDDVAKQALATTAPEGDGVGVTERP